MRSKTPAVLYNQKQKATQAQVGAESAEIVGEVQLAELEVAGVAHLIEFATDKSRSMVHKVRECSEDDPLVLMLAADLLKTGSYKIKGIVNGLYDESPFSGKKR
jgi:hypothetical protein